MTINKEPVVIEEPVIETVCLTDDLVGYTVTGENVTVTVYGEPAELTGEVAPGAVIAAISSVDATYSEVIVTAAASGLFILLAGAALTIGTRRRFG